MHQVDSESGCSSAKTPTSELQNSRFSTWWNSWFRGFHGNHTTVVQEWCLKEEEPWCGFVLLTLWFQWKEIEFLQWKDTFKQFLLCVTVQRHLLPFPRLTRIWMNQFGVKLNDGSAQSNWVNSQGECSCSHSSRAGFVMQLQQLSSSHAAAWHHPFSSSSRSGYRSTDWYFLI